MGRWESPTLFTIPVLVRYAKTYGLTHEQLAMVSVVQREWAAKNPRATFKTPITVEDVLNSRMIAYPFRLLQCCLVTDGGGALILVAAERANGGGLSYMHSGMYGMYALQESVRQMRGTAPAQIPGAKISICHGVGGMFAASGTIIMSNEPRYAGR